MATTSLRLPPSPKVMFLGDSLTAGVGPLPSALYGGARAFVLLEFPTLAPYGSTPPGGDSSILLPLGRNAHEGHGGFLMSQMASGIAGWLSGTGVTIDCVLLHGGSNGGGTYVGGTQMCIDVVTIYNAFMAHNPKGVLVVGCNTGVACSNPGDPAWAGFLPEYPSAYAALVGNFARMKTVVDTLPRAISVDCGSLLRYGSNVGGVLKNADIGADFLHPQYIGYQKMAAGWCEGLRRLRVGMSQ